MTFAEGSPALLDPKLAESFEAAEAIMREQAVSFYQAFRSLPPERFRAVTAVYAFCRYADDVVDEGGSSSLPLLDDLERGVHHLYHGVADAEDGGDSMPDIASGKPWWDAFAFSTAAYHVREADLMMQITGQRMDAHFHDLENTQELVEYARLVAGSVGRVLVPILVKDSTVIGNDEFMKACESLGVAMQITNILRDVGEDIRERDRVYIPRSLMLEFGISRADLEALSKPRQEELRTDVENTATALDVPQNFVRLWEHLAALADDCYLPYERWISAFDESARFPLLCAAKLYQAIEQAVRDHDYNCFTRRCYTDATTRETIVRDILSALRPVQD
ncbi:MAG: phytoene/squalene synthase family protein [Bifidobacterium crudilactis]|nr:phytoene/squalene synthase family protein [Bifidobacterium crudilactis]MCI1889464.1 phytoene/squalene synthase family protein [Bifidobacterium crudilactis]